MSDLHLELVCSADAEEMTRIRIALRATLLAMGRLPHWQERYEPATTGILYPALKVNGKLCWHKGQGTLPESGTLAEHVERLASGRWFKYKTRFRTALSFTTALVIAFFPKCPFCWAAYMSLLSAFGVQTVSYQPWLLPVLVGIFAVNLFSLYVTRRRHGYMPLLFALAGACVILVNKFTVDALFLLWLGAFLVAVASLWNSINTRVANSIKYHFSSLVKIRPEG